MALRRACWRRGLLTALQRIALGATDSRSHFTRANHCCRTRAEHIRLPICSATPQPFLSPSSTTHMIIRLSVLFLPLERAVGLWPHAARPQGVQGLFTTPSSFKLKGATHESQQRWWLEDVAADDPLLSCDDWSAAPDRGMAALRRQELTWCSRSRRQGWNDRGRSVWLATRYPRL